MSTTTALLTGEGQLKCCYCRQGHSSSSRGIVTDTSQRKAILKKVGHCFVCLKRHHMSKDCRSSVKCARCGGRHRTSICNSSHTVPKSEGNKQHTDSQHHAASGSSTPVTTHSASIIGTISAATVNITTRAADLSDNAALLCEYTSPIVATDRARAYVHKLHNPRCGMTIRLMLYGGANDLK